MIPPQRQQLTTAPATGVQGKVDLMPLMDLITFSVAPGTWHVQDGYGHDVPSKKPASGDAPADQQNAMVPFFLSISLIIKCPEDVHEDIAHFLRCLRRLQDINQRMKESNGLLGASNSPSEPESDGNKRTKVADMPDVDVLVSESKRVIGVAETTLFEIRLANYGTKAAKNLMIRADLSPNLEIVSVTGMQNDMAVATDQSKRMLKFSPVAQLEPGKVMIFGFHAKATGEKPKLATCKVIVAQDDLPHTIEDMAAVKVKSRPSAAIGSDDRSIR